MCMYLLVMFLSKICACGQHFVVSNFQMFVYTYGLYAAFVIIYHCSDRVLSLEIITGWSSLMMSATIFSSKVTFRQNLSVSAAEQSSDVISAGFRINLLPVEKLMHM